MSGALVYTEVVDNNDPGSQIQLFSVNDSGVAVGDIVDASGEHSFVAGPSVQDIFDVGTSGLNSASLINNSGEIIGSYQDALGNGSYYSVPLNNLSGATAVPDVPANGNIDAIDANGDIVGVLNSGEQFQVVGGVVTDVPSPNFVNYNTISEDGHVALIVSEILLGNIFEGFENVLATSTGVGGGPLANLPPRFTGSGVNDAGQVIGADGNEASFFRDTDGTVYGISIPGATITAAEGINDNGEIVGWYLVGSGHQAQVHAFTTTVANVIAADDILAVACYCAGTLIACDTGDVPVEDLKIGDMLQTSSGALRPIKWIGRRSYGGRFVAGNKDILPVCIKTGALADNVPRRDLWISPHHAMFIDGLLIEARHLVNGTSIVQADRADTVSYFHVELGTHDVIVAEGALSETYLDEDNRGMFQNAEEYETLLSGVPALAAQYCAPRADDGYELEAVRRRLSLRAGAAGPRIAKIA
jgi:hypothetical protein